jgi:hypothetical protein
MGQARNTWLAWRDTRPTAFAPHLYARPDWSEEWSKIVELSKKHKLLLLSYGTGAHHYFPTLDNPDVWSFQYGQLLDADERRLIEKIQAAEVVVEDVSLGPLEVLYYDNNVQHEFGILCLKESSKNYQIWWRLSPADSRAGCKKNPFVLERSKDSLERPRPSF